jgi:uncharacterized protein YndB with AHSA1/START domain
MATAQITPDNDTILAEVFIAAPPDRVFEAIADPQQLVQWWGQKGVFQVVETKSDLRVGGKWSYEGIGDFETVVRWELEPHEVHGLHTTGTHRVGTGTLLRIRHSGFAGHLDQVKSHHTGWSASLAWLQAFVEKGETMDTRN